MPLRERIVLKYLASLIAIIGGAYGLYDLYWSLSNASSSWLNVLPSYPLYVALLFIVYLSILICGIALLAFQQKHKIIGVSLMICAVLGLYIWGVALDATTPILDAIAHGALFTAGILSFAFKPKAVKENVRPFRRLVIAGGIISLLGLIGKGAIKLILIYALFQSTPPLTTLLSYIGLILIVGLIFYAAIIIMGFKLKTEDNRKLNRLSKEILLLVVVLSILDYLIPILFGSLFLTSLLTYLQLALTTATGYRLPSIALSTLILSILNYLIAFGVILIISGSLLGLAKSKKLSLVDYLYANKRILIAVIILIIAFLAVIPYYSSYKTASDNAMALKQLNQKIYEYGGNARYLLSNATLYYAAMGTTPSATVMSKANATAFYNYLYNQASNQTDIPEVLGAPWQQNSSFNSGVRAINWGTSHPMIRALIVDTFYSLGIPVFNGSAGISTKSMLVPKTATDLEDMYTLQFAGTYILSTSVIIGQLFSANVFDQHGRVPSQLVGDAMINQDPILTGTFSVTTLLNSTVYDSLNMNFYSGWLGLVYSMGINPANTTNTPLTTKNLMYLFSLNQYEGYLFSQILYNKTSTSNIDFIGYAQNGLLVNMGNINLTASYPIVLYVDGHSTNYTRYYNFLISNLSMSVGLHNVTVSIGNHSMTQKLYVSPMMVDESLDHNGILHFGLWSPDNNVSVSNVTFLAQPPSFDYANPSFYKFFNMTVPSAIPGAITLISSNLTNHTTFSYQAQTQGCNIGTPRMYFLSADTSLGKANYVIYVKCV